MTRRAPLRWKPPHVTYPCAHCGWRTDRLTHAWAHGLLHGYGRAG